MADEFSKLDFLSDFQAECREHLSRLNQWLLDLEKSPGNRGTVEGIGRELHTLKAASRLMGFVKMEAVVHKLEDLFEAVHNKKIPFDSQINDLVLDTLDVIEKDLAALPEEIEIDLAQLKTNIDLARDGQAVKVTLPGRTRHTSASRPAAATAESSLRLPTDSTAHPIVTPSPAAGSPSVAKEFVMSGPSEESDGSVRVRTAKLDGLFNMVGELVMCKLRSKESEAQMQRLVATLQGLSDYWSHIRKRLTGGNRALPVDSVKKMEEKLLFVEKLGMAALTNITADAAQLSNVTEGMRDGIMQLRMLPLQHLFQSLPRVVRDSAREEGKAVLLTVTGEDIEVDRKILEQLKDPMLHLMRNAVSHGIEPPSERAAKKKPTTGQVTVKAVRQGSQILIQVQDDGRGIDWQQIRDKAATLGLLAQEEVTTLSDQESSRLIFTPGFSTKAETSTVSGRGMGMHIVATTIANLKGSVGVDTQIGQGTTFTIRLPLSLATMHILLVRIGEEIYAVPIHTVREIIFLKPDMAEKIQDEDCICLRNDTIPLVDLAAVLDRPVKAHPVKRKVALIASLEGTQHIAFGVDEVLGEQEIVSKLLGSQVRKVPYIQGASILGKGEAVLILDVAKLFQASRSHKALSAQGPNQTPTPRKRKGRVLVVDDSLTTRRLEQAILEAAGYQVEVAVNGEDALHRLKQQKYDILITDIQMPVMDGLALTRQVRQIAELKDLPVIIVSAMEQEEDKTRGLAAGAQEYITKGQFNQDALITLIEKLQH